MENKKTLIIDLDGTLYYQYGVQCIMGCRMLLYYSFHFWKWKEFMIILDYRRKRESKIKDIVDKQYLIIANKYNENIDKVKDIIGKWMFQKPLKVIRFFKDRKLCEILDKLKSKNINIIVYSDYPTKEKLEALGVYYDKAYDSTHPEIHVLKPDKKGLEYIIENNKLQRDKILFVGDRDSKDGECARQCKVDYIILPKLFRKNKHIEIEQKMMAK